MCREMGRAPRLPAPPHRGSCAWHAVSSSSVHEQTSENFPSAFQPHAGRSHPRRRLRQPQQSRNAGGGYGSVAERPRPPGPPKVLGARRCLARHAKTRGLCFAKPPLRPFPHLMPEAAPPAETARLSLLVVEDHEATSVVMAKLLQRRGHTVVTVGSCAEARVACAAQKFDASSATSACPMAAGTS